MSIPTRQFRWEEDEDPITPDAIYSPPYSYGPRKDWEGRGQDEFRLDDIAWATPERLADRIKSGDLAPSQKPPAKKWLLAQLHLYGIHHKKLDRVADLKAVLVKAWKDGKVRDMANAVFATLPNTDISALTSRRPLLLCGTVCRTSTMKHLNALKTASSKTLATILPERFSVMNAAL